MQNVNGLGFYPVSVLSSPPQACADIRGSEKYSSIRGRVSFYCAGGGVLVAANIRGLPVAEQNCESPVFAFHIHSGESCTGDAEDPFKDALSHYNPNNCPHPYHAGDMPPLFGCNGSAYLVFFTERFKLSDVIDKVVIIHAKPDDFATQPSGNSGEKIACGKIRRCR